jgi:hypothetical protein
LFSNPKKIEWENKGKVLHFRKFFFLVIWWFIFLEVPKSGIMFSGNQTVPFWNCSITCCLLVHSIDSLQPHACIGGFSTSEDSIKWWACYCGWLIRALSSKVQSSNLLLNSLILLSYWIYKNVIIHRIHKNNYLF